MADNTERVVLDRTKYPSASKVAVDKEPKPQVNKIASGKRVKKPFHKRFANAFLDGEPAREVGDYILNDVVIPAAKTTIADLVEGAIDMILFGGGRVSRPRSPYSRRDDRRSPTPYNSMHTRDRHSRTVTDNRGRSRANDVSDVLFDRRGEAEAVLSELIDTVNKYEVATVRDFFEMAGISASYTDQKWGWTDVSDARVSRVRDGWIVDLPRPVVVD